MIAFRRLWIGSPRSASRNGFVDRLERAFLLGIDGLEELRDWSPNASLSELAQLVTTAGAEVIGHRLVRIREPNPATLIGPGQLREAIDAANTVDADVLVVDAELLPRQQRNIERAFDGKIIDRTGVILDIFAGRAQTAEGRLQVERAQLEYLLPRLSELWVEFSRQRGGIGPFRGPGETQIETDRRLYRDRIRDLDAQLQRVRKQRSSRRQRRRNLGLKVAALVGYTNAGKSSLLNALTDASVLTENRLFATLDPTTRRIDLTCGGEMLLTDTVGFIQRLPPRLVDAFRATLEEVLEADVLVHVVDAVAPAMRQQVQVVEQTLFHIGVSQRPVITALNKSDLDPQHDTADFPNAVLVSALTGSGLNELRSRLAEMVRVSTVNVTVCIPYSAGELVSLFHQRGTVLHEAHESRGTLIEGTLPPDLAPRYQAYRTDPDR